MAHSMPGIPATATRAKYAIACEGRVSNVPLTRPAERLVLAVRRAALLGESCQASNRPRNAVAHQHSYIYYAQRGFACASLPARAFRCMFYLFYLEAASDAAISFATQLSFLCFIKRERMDY